MTWLLDNAQSILAIAAALIVGFSFGVLYSHGHERREFKRIARRGRK